MQHKIYKQATDANFYASLYATKTYTVTAHTHKPSQSCRLVGNQLIPNQIQKKTRLDPVFAITLKKKKKGKTEF